MSTQPDTRYLQEQLMDDDFRRNLGGEEQLDFIFEEQAARHLREMRDFLRIGRKRLVIRFGADRRHAGGL